MNINTDFAGIINNVKRILALQGRIIPNFLHVIYVLEFNHLSLTNFVAFLSEKEKKVDSGE